MNDEKVLEQLQLDHRHTADKLGQLAETMAKIESKLDKLEDIDNSINNLAEQDKLLHQRVSEKTDEIHDLDLRMTVVETKTRNNRWWIATAIAVTVALATVAVIFLR